MPYLFVIDGIKNEYRILELKEILNIGRDAVNDLVLDSPDVSRLHGSILREEDGAFVLVDQNSTNGIEVNGCRATQHRLQHGDTFSISTFSFTYLNTKPRLPGVEVETAAYLTPEDTDATVFLDREAFWKKLPQTEKTEPENPPQGGKLLRMVRQNNNISIREASSRTRISLTNLKAIEAEDFANLPIDTFLRPYLVTYAEFLGLDGSKVAREYLQKRDQQIANGKLSPRKNVSTGSVISMERGSFLSRLRVTLVFFLAFVAGFLLFSFQLHL